MSRLTSMALRFGSVLGLVALLAAGSARLASAHDKEVRINLDSWTPDPQQPLTRLYEAQVQYSGDQEPVVGARLDFTASRQEGNISDVSGVAFVAVADSPGAYVAQIHYPRFGTWDITLRTEIPGQGEATTTEDIRPGGADSRLSPAAAPRNLDIAFTLDRSDAVNILVRLGHSIGAASYLAFTASLLMSLWFGSYLAQSLLWRRLDSAAFPMAIFSLVLLVASGVYIGYFDAPVRAPGIFNLAALASVPYGFAWLAAFWLKPAFAGAVLVVVCLARKCRGRGLVQAMRWRRLTVAFGALVTLLLGNVVVLMYLHSISHLSASLASR